MRRLIWIIAFIFLNSFFSYSQGITGNWYGALKINGQYLHLVFHVTKINDTTYNTTWDSPDQGGKGLASHQTLFTNNKLIIDISNYGINYTGTFLPDSNKITGILTQGNIVMPLTLSDNNNKRIQDPKDFPYKQEDVVFTNTKAGDQLAGTLTLPANGKATKIVVLITGSGPQNRNEEVFDHRPFLIWSDWLTRNGIAVLRYDDRGFAQSTGNYQTATTADFADDAAAAINFIQSRNDLKNLSIGLMGHSEGGIIVPMVASRNKSVKFIILLAGPGIPVLQLMLKQTADQTRLSGASEANVQGTVEIIKNLYITVIEHPELSAIQLKQKIDTLIRQNNSLSNVAKDNILASIPALVSPWYRYFLAINPEDYLIKVKCAVLALGGSMDMQVNSEANLAGIKASLEKGRNKHYEIVPLIGLNHLFQKADNGSVAEYEQLIETVNPMALQKVSDWINQL